LVIETSLHYDVRIEKHQIIQKHVTYQGSSNDCPSGIRVPSILTDFLRSSPQFLSLKDVMILHIRPRSLASKSFPVNHPSVTLPYYAAWAINSVLKIKRTQKCFIYYSRKHACCERIHISLFPSCFFFFFSFI
jgi:hypothetical protein